MSTFSDSSKHGARHIPHWNPIRAFAVPYEGLPFQFVCNITQLGFQ